MIVSVLQVLALSWIIDILLLQYMSRLLLATCDSQVYRPAKQTNRT